MRKTGHRKFPQNSREIGQFFCKFVPNAWIMFLMVLLSSQTSVNTCEHRWAEEPEQ